MVHSNYHDEVFGDGTNHFEVPLTYLLSQLDLSVVAREIENHYYSSSAKRRFHYRIDLMLKLVAYQRYRHLTFRTVIDSLTMEDIANHPTTNELKRYREGTFKHPSPSTLHHFITYRLGENGVKFQ